MTEKEKKLLADFEKGMKRLMYLCDALKDENVQLKQQLEQKDVEIRDLTVEMERIRISYENLKFAKSFSTGNNEDVVQARKRLSKLVRDVDKCIAMLKV